MGDMGLRAAAERHVGDSLVPGLAAVAARGDQAEVLTLGSVSIGGPPVRRDSLFRIASTSKPITAAATLALVDEGLLALDEPVDRLLPELADRRVLRRMDGPLDETVPARRPITTRDLLTFTCGFGMVAEMFQAETPWPVVAAASELDLQQFGPPDPARQPDPDTWIARFGSLPLMAQPGEKWMYNTGASILSVLLARAAGTSLADVLRTRLFEPLGMRDTAFWTKDTDRLTTAYRPAPDGLVEWDGPDGTWSTPPAFCDGAAGLVSTIDDLLAFARMLLEGGAPVLSDRAVAAMTSVQLTAEQRTSGAVFLEEGTSWGFGQAVAANGAYGWDGGYGTSFLVDPNEELVVIVATQRMFDSPALPPVHQDIRAAAYAHVAHNGR
ncbi:serine hydrolase domain-containing protein [Pseudonocardia spinosispora]|uniref:serine hydrolase domain-containing protein n=1 Tax=Pseudonocardia spinosispora TaxID=103441 RepID=UPI000429C032|nr:serine hydrolase domain-containing protein [Pseudonocardia spinosispora]